MKTLLFVYNAESGLMNGMFDFFHKIIKPDSYNCSLCMITHHSVGKRNAWKDYLESLTIETRFYHKDEFLKEYPRNNTAVFPAIFLSDYEIINTEEFNGLKPAYDYY